MYEEIKSKAEKKVEEKKGFYIVAMIFLGVSIILGILSTVIGGPAAFWIRFPIIVLALVLAAMYFAIFGFPFSRVLSASWEQEELEKEMYRLYQQKKGALPPPEDLSEEDRLELKELERLKRKWEDGSDFV